MTNDNPSRQHGQNIAEFSVSSLTKAIKNQLEGEFSHIRLRGEISSLTIASSGHGYLTLKDTLTNDIIDGVCWRGTLSRMTVKPEAGLEMIATGRITNYGERSRYQIVIENLELAGEGALLQQLEERKKRLLAEGLFAQDKKQALPQLPKRICVITSPKGAVIRDILHRLNDRFPRHVMIWPCPVQGKEAAAKITHAIKSLSKLYHINPDEAPDLLIVARGGGSLEDLWAFNDEDMVRALANCPIPTISAIGHETDHSLCDLAADHRAPTPTAAAEMAVPVLRDLRLRLNETALRIDQAMGRYLTRWQDRLQDFKRLIPKPESILQNAMQRLDDRHERMKQALMTRLANDDLHLRHLTQRLIAPERLIINATERLDRIAPRLDYIINEQLKKQFYRYEMACDRLEANSFKSILARGYVVMRDETGQVIPSGRDLNPLQRLQATFGDGSHVEMDVVKVNKR